MEKGSSTKTPQRNKQTEINSLKGKIEKLNAENRKRRNSTCKKPVSGLEKELQDKIMELEDEKGVIEESLRGEVLDNAEKRNQIEILKEALETKIEDLGLKELLEMCVVEGSAVDEVFLK